MDHKESFLTHLTNARGFTKEDAFIIYEAFVNSKPESLKRGDHDATDFVTDLAQEALKTHLEELQNGINKIVENFKKTTGLTDIEIDSYEPTIQECFKFFKVKVLPTLVESNMPNKSMSDHSIVYGKTIDGMKK